MRVRARASASGSTSQLLISTDASGVRITLDTMLLYDVPADEWHEFSSNVVNATALPPNLPAHQWTTAEARSEGSGVLRQGERQQLLISAIHLLMSVGPEVLFEDEPFGLTDGATTFYGRRFTDNHGNFIYVPAADAQIQLLENPAQSQEMCSVGYLFDFESEDEHGNIVRLFYRPYNTGFATSSRWPNELQILRGLIEAGRNRPN